MGKEQKKTLFLFGGILVAGGSLYYLNENPILMFIGIMISAYLIIKGME